MAVALVGVLALTAATVVAGPVDAEGRHRSDRLNVTVERAPVDPDGDLVGAGVDIVITFRNLDPSIDGIGLQAGGSVTVTLPPEFVNTGSLPVASTGSAPDCAPPLVSGCSTAVLLQGWPQSPVLPFPSVTWDKATNSVTVTAAADWLPAGVDAPGPKQVHLMLFGFTNPERPGRYPVGVEVRPDPASDETLRGVGRALIRRDTRPSINPNSQANGAPPPPFPNTLFQSVTAGEESLTMAFYLFQADTGPYLGVDFDAGSARNRALRDSDGRRIGWVKIRAPHGARHWSLDSDGPSAEATAFITGVPTGRLTAALQTDPAASGRYVVEFRLAGGNAVRHVIAAN